MQTHVITVLSFVSKAVFTEHTVRLLFCRVDSIMLVEEGFNMMSVDASDKMLKYALKARWERRKEPAFDKWGMKVFCIPVFL